MKSIPKRFNLLGVCLALAVLPAVSLAQDTVPLECGDVPLSFGDVGLGAVSTLIVTCTFYEPDHSVLVSFVEGGAGAFMIEPILPPGAVLPYWAAPGERVDFEVRFAPALAGNHQARWWIQGNSPAGGGTAIWYETGMMQGDGVLVEALPPEDIQAVLDFMDAAVADGTLEGEGPGNSADNRLNALQNMIRAAGDVAAFAVQMTERPLYVAPGTQGPAVISGDFVAFSDRVDPLYGDYDVWFGDVNTGGFFNLTNDPAESERVTDIEGSRVAYTEREREPLSHRSIRVQDALQPADVGGFGFIFENSTARLGGDYLIWSQERETWDVHAYSFSLGTEWEVAASLEADEIAGGVSQGRFVYEERVLPYPDPERNVWLYDVSDLEAGPVKTLIDEGAAPVIDGDWIAYTKETGDPNGADVFLYEIGSGNPPRNITNRPGPQGDVTIAGHNVAYTDWSMDGEEADVYLYLIDAQLTLRVTERPGWEAHADVGLGHVVYVVFVDPADPWETDIFVTDFSVITSQVACDQLAAALKKCDGEPEDFVEGEAREELYAMILELMTDLGCEVP